MLEEDESTQCERSRLNNQIELLKSNISSQESYIKTLETSINDFSEQLKVFETTLDLNSLICMNLSMVFSTARNLFNHSMGNGIVPILTLGKKEFPLTFAIINQATYSQYYCADIGKYTDDKFEHEEYLSLSHLFENPEFNHSWFEREEIKVFKTNYQNKDHLKRAMNNLLELSKTILQGLTSK
ncbi:MAG: hypothetical protein KDD40_03720 [Bdellovibrionales bacterium]|nr:hypothetical protein [Bdellovibrionales bacterium]